MDTTKLKYGQPISAADLNTLRAEVRTMVGKRTKGSPYTPPSSTASEAGVLNKENINELVQGVLQFADIPIASGGGQSLYQRR